MRIGGFQRSSLVDYPGKIAAVIFTSGCNLRCGYCHNKELVDPSFLGRAIDTETVFAHLNMRKHLLQGVVITGGEPTLQPDLKEFLALLRQTNLSIKVDTNGTKPAVVSDLIAKNLVDYFAIDVKADPHTYETVTNRSIDVALIQQTIDLIRRHGIDHELRLTVGNAHPFCDDDLGSTRHGSLDRYAEIIGIANQEPVFIQNIARNVPTLSPEWSEKGPCSKEAIETLRNELGARGVNCEIR